MDISQRLQPEGPFLCVVGLHVFLFKLFETLFQTLSIDCFRKQGERMTGGIKEIPLTQTASTPAGIQSFPGNQQIIGQARPPGRVGNDSSNAKIVFIIKLNNFSDCFFITEILVGQPLRQDHRKRIIQRL